MGDRKIAVVSVPRALCQPFVVLAGEVRRLLFLLIASIFEWTFPLSSPPLQKPKAKKLAEMANFCRLSDGNHAKPLSLAWCLPETINRTETQPWFTQATTQSCETVSEPGWMFWSVLTKYGGCKKMKILLSYLLGLGFHCRSFIELCLPPDALKLVSTYLLAFRQVR